MDEPCPSFSHDALVKKARSMLKYRFGCPVVCVELVTGAWETPDAYGFKDSGQTSILIECKTSRPDFLADKKKPFRASPEMGMGNYRYFMAPAGLIDVKELPSKWGLIEVPVKGAPCVVHGRQTHQYRDREFLHEVLKRNEIMLMHSFTRRLLAGTAGKYK